MKTKIICFDAPDLRGKTTQSKLCVKALKDVGYKSLYVKIPSKYNFITYNLIYWMLNNGLALKLPYTFHILQFINKFLFQILILPILSLFYDIIVFDRWAISALVYGRATNVNNTLNQFFYDCMLKPNITFILTRDIIQNNREHNSYDDDRSLQDNVKFGYRELVINDKTNKIKAIDASGTIEQVHLQVLYELNKFLVQK